MLRGDPVLIKPVSVFGTEYQVDIGWTDRQLLQGHPRWIRSYWKTFEMTSVFGTLLLVAVEVYLLLNQALLDLGLVVLLAWVIWLEVNRHLLARHLRISTRSFLVESARY